MAIKNGKVIIHAVHYRDVKGLWKKLKLKEVESCAICGEEVTTDNVAAFGQLAGKVRVCCEKGLCFMTFNALVKKKGRDG